MDIISAMLLYTISFGMISIGIFIASRNEKSIIMKVFNRCYLLCTALLPLSLTSCLRSTTDYLLYTRNAMMQVVYIVLLAIGYTSYSLTAYTYVNETLFGQIPFLLLGINIFFFFTCSMMDPGYINEKNVKQYIGRYTYDGLMYHEKRLCRTCSTEKPARSKHCGICDQCISRFDHHCSWVNNCIGQRNHKVFILFIFSLVVITLLSSFVVLMVFIHIIEQRKLLESTYTDSTGELFKASFSTVTTFLISEYTMMAFLLIYLVLLFIAVGCFLCFHIFLVITNRTTNEICKSKKTVDAIDHIKDDVNSRATKGGKSNNKTLNRRTRNKASNLQSPSKHLKQTKGFSRSIFGVYSRGVLRNVWEVVAG